MQFTPVAAAESGRVDRAADKNNQRLAQTLGTCCMHPAPSSLQESRPLSYAVRQRLEAVSTALWNAFKLSLALSLSLPQLSPHLFL